MGKTTMCKGLLLCCAIAFSVEPVFSQTTEYLHYRLGMKYKTDRQYDKAIEEFRKVLAEYPDNYNVYLHIAEIRFVQNQPALAIPNLKQALTYNPGWGKAHKLLADAYSKDGQIQKSIAEYQQYQQTCDPAERDSVQKVIDRLVTKIGKKPSPGEVEKRPIAAVDEDFITVPEPVKAANVPVPAEKPVVTPPLVTKPVETATPVAVKPVETAPVVVKPTVTTPPVVAPVATKLDGIEKDPVEKKPVGTESAVAAKAVEKAPAAKTPVEIKTPVTKAAETPSVVPDNPKAADLFKLAVASFHARQYDSALKQLKEVIALQPGFPGAYYYAGIIRFERGERALARINLIKGKSYKEPEFSGLLYLGTIYGEERNYPEAVNQLSAFVAKTSSDSGRKQGKELLKKYRALLGRTATLAKQDHPDDSSAMVTDIMLAGPLMLEFRIDTLLSMVSVDTMSDAGRKLVAGIRSFQSGEYDAAVREFKKTLLSYPAGPVAVQCLYNLGVCYFKLRLFKEAENQFQQILDRYPANELAAQSLFLKALAYSEQKETVVAEQLFRTFLQSNRGHKWEGKAWEKLGDAYLDLDQPKKAIDAFMQAAGKTGNHEDQVCAWYKIGNAFSVIDNQARAFAAFDSAIALGERRNVYIRVPDSYYRVADEKYKAKDYAGALDYYQAVIRKYPDFQETPWALFQIGNIQKNLRKFKEAIATYNDLIRRFPEDYWARQARWKQDDAVWEHEYQTTLH